MNRFWLWMPEDGEKEEDGREVKVSWDWQKIYDAEAAAEIYFEQRHSDFDYPEELHVCVRAMTMEGEPYGKTFSYRVEAEQTIEFHAREMTP